MILEFHLQLSRIFAKMSMRGECMEFKSKHSAQSILSLQFNIDFKGYAPLEVDRLLDEIIADYQLFNETFDYQQELITRYQKEIANLQSSLIECESKLSMLNQDQTQPSQTDVLKRLARLEQILAEKSEN